MTSAVSNILGSFKSKKKVDESKVDASDNDKVATPLPKDDPTKTKLLTSDPVDTVSKDDPTKTKTTTSDPVGTVPLGTAPVTTTDSTVPTTAA